MSKDFKLLLWALIAYSVYSLEINEEISSSLNETNEEVNRLTDQTLPVSYELRIVTDLEKFSFIGEVRITVIINSSTNNVKLHSKNLNITNCQVFDGETPVQSTHKLDADKELLVIEPHQQLIPESSYVLVIKFQGVLNDELSGFYRTSYVNDNQIYWLATTQFEETFARQAFPCFDEIRFKAPFTIYLAHFSNQKVISNMPAEIKLPVDPTIGNRVWTKFRTSPPMSTYLVAFVISDFNFKSNENERYNVWAKENAIEYSSYTLKQTAIHTKYFEDYTNISFTLPKLDIVAIPRYEGAMENWGMISFSEIAILDELTNSQQHKSDLNSLLCHEIAHQWFGNLVTPASWNYYWLKEGFATYFQYFAIAAEDPTWNMDHLFVIDVVHNAFNEDTHTPKAMTTKVNPKIQIEMDFAGYEKAASIIRMFEHVVSSSLFKTVLLNFLKNGVSKHNGVVRPSNLFEEFEELGNANVLPLPQGVSISQIMKIWSENIGFPMVTVIRNLTTNKIKLQCTTYQGLEVSDDVPAQEWIIPVTYTTKSQLKFSDTKPTLWLFANKDIDLPQEVDPEDWILLNLQQIGYYRINYDWKTWQLLIEQLYRDPTKIHVLNRVQLIDDAIDLAADGKLNYNTTFLLLQYLSKEPEMIPWLSAIEPLHALYHKYEGTSSKEYLKKFLHRILEPAYRTFGFGIKSTDSHIEKIVKPKLLYLACEIGIEGCIREALDEYMKNKDDPNKVQPDLKRVVFCTALRYSADQHNIFHKLWSIRRKSAIPFDKATISSTLECVENEETIKEILLKSIDSKYHETNRSVYYSSIPFTDTALVFLKEQIQQINELDEYKIIGLKSIVLDLVIKTEQQAYLLKQLAFQLDHFDQKKYDDLKQTIRDKYDIELGNILKKENETTTFKSIVRVIVQEYENTPSSGSSNSSRFFKWWCLIANTILYSVTWSYLRI